MVTARPDEDPVVEARELPTPVPKRGQVRIRVRCATLSLLEQQWFPKAEGRGNNRLTASLPTLLGVVGSPLGNGVSGVVDMVGPDVDSFAVGDRVFGPTVGLRGADTAQSALLKASRCAVIPDGVSFAQSAAMTDSFETALGAVRAAGVRRGMNVLVFGSSGGVALFTAEHQSVGAGTGSHALHRRHRNRRPGERAGAGK